MTDPFRCLRNSTIAIALWNLVYSFIQIGLFGWQIKYCRDRQWELGNRNSEIPWNGVDRAQALHPGLYEVYSETPEKRRINALFALAITSEIASCVHLCLTIVLLIGAIKCHENYIWPWIISAGIIIGTSTAYAMLWWSGDVFGEQLVMSISEFIMSLAVNGICTIVVVFYFFRLRGDLTSVKPKERTERRGFKGLPKEIPDWRKEWDKNPPKMFEKKLRRQRRRSQNRQDSMRSSGRRASESRSKHHKSQFHRLSLSPKAVASKYYVQQRDRLPVQQAVATKNSHRQEPWQQKNFSPWEASTLKKPTWHYNWLYLSQERLDAHNAHFDAIRKTSRNV